MLAVVLVLGSPAMNMMLPSSVVHSQKQVDQIKTSSFNLPLVNLWDLLPFVACFVCFPDVGVCHSGECCRSRQACHFLDVVDMVLSKNKEMQIKNGHGINVSTVSNVMGSMQLTHGVKRRTL